MRHKDAFWVTLLLLYFQAESSALQLNGVLGESVTFQINESKPFATISWRTEKNGRFRTLAVVAPGKPCKLFIPLAALKDRLNSTGDCRNLQLSRLGREDINRYTANIILTTTSESVEEHFDLKVYKRLKRKDLSIKCTIDRGRRKLLQLNCSVKRWKDQLDLQWFVADEIVSQVTRENVLTINYTNREIFDQEVSCKAKNPVSQVSKTMTLREACPRHQRYVKVTEMMSGFISAGLSMLTGIVIAFIILLGKCLARPQRIPGPPLPITSQAAWPNAQNPPAPLQRPPGWER
ncbi:SLAM family member 9-like [Crotalus adamanteus]|uniref:SLAM family member 9-like n=1 Tax=Crotalus adamanteus TaxID=8729 RepID=A0AAW1APR2_CROAD